MKKRNTKTSDSLKKSDLNPYSKHNTAFRKRHAITVSEFRSSAKRYQAECT